MKTEQTEHILFRIVIAALLLCSVSLGGLDQSGNTNAMNMTVSDFSALVPLSDVQSAFVDTSAPQATSADAGTEIAVYTEQAPPATDLRKLMPSAVLKNPPRYMYYNGNYLAWNDFSTTFPSNKPGLWIERAVSWTLYATLPWGGWTRELIYVPQASPVTMYEIYPSGFVLGYNLGPVQPGYYYIWYYADAPGRHSSVLYTNSGFSNAVIIDVYVAGNYVKPTPPTPKPSPKEECEKKPYCHWVNNQCLCTMPPLSEKEKCEQNPTCDWVNGHCYCRGLEDPEKEKCEQNPTCDWSNGHCYCRGLDPEPMPGPVPNPNPGPEPEPFNPAPNPVAECQESGCQWANGRCNCMGLGGGIDYSNNGNNVMDEGEFAD
ncbi:MAG: hypothetical protein JW999_04115, partial [Methanotrichaceae archaeon]|nr:hypothetical protein [Methanotrichaceae archaeon]